jgi:hypothetical protein
MQTHWLTVERLPQLSPVIFVIVGVLSIVPDALPSEAFTYHARVHGGVSAAPFLVNIVSSNQHVTVDWKGFGGPYQLYQCPSLDVTNWTKAGFPVSGTSVAVPTAGEMAIYRVAGASPSFGAAVSCGDCHTNLYPTWTNTAHAGALRTLESMGMEANPQCLPCHTVGYGYPTGYKNQTETPFYAGVQCVNCHGPAGTHYIYPTDPAKRPLVSLSAEICGGCHQDFDHPYFEEWSQSGHSFVTPEIASSILTSGEARMNSCGPCHSGAVRLALLKGDPLPSRVTAAETPATCAVCHDPHVKTANGSQLRNPIASTNFFSYITATNFASQYNPEISICGQCHNARGAAWKDTSRPPHHSPQYNMLVGNIGVVEGTPIYSTHRDIQKQCTQCHTHSHDTPNPSPDNPIKTGHTFEARMNNCEPCHSEESATARTEITQSDIKQLVAIVQGQLDQWGQTKSPEALRTKYGNLAWEYSSPGVLSNPTSDPNIKGPTSQEQASVPDAIKQARFNVYLVVHDGSFGVHNGKYARFLLQVALDKVDGLLAQP